MIAGRTLQCPSCGGSVRVHAVGYTVTVACQYCGSELDVAHPDVRLITEYHRDAARLSLPLGSRGMVFGTEYEAIGALERTDGDAAWTEYLLFNPYAGYRWLVDYDGEWTFGVMLVDRPDGDAETVTWRGARFTRDGAAQTIETTRVHGEFYWRARAGDRVEAVAFERGDETLSGERTGDELTWTHLVLVPRRDIGQAFGLDDATPPRVSPSGGGVASRAVANFARMPASDERDLAAMLGLAFTTVAMILMVMAFLSGPVTRAYTRGQVPIGATREGLKIGTITVSRSWQFVTITADSENFTNRWVDLDYSLVNRATQQSIDAYGLVEFYAGRDSDGSWTEGSHHARTLVSHVPRGTYDVYVDASAHDWPNDPAPGASNPWGMSETTSVWIEARTGGVSWGNFWTMVVLLAAAPCMMLWWGLRNGDSE